MGDRTPVPLTTGWRGLRLSVAATVFGVLLWIVATHAFGLPHPHCPFRGRGLRCPSCGLTTSVEAALGGEWERSRRAHPAGIPVLVFLTVVSLCQPLSWMAPHRAVIAANGLLFIGGWVVLCARVFGWPGATSLVVVGQAGPW